MLDHVIPVEKVSGTGKVIESHKSAVGLVFLAKVGDGFPFLFRTLVFQGWV